MKIRSLRAGERSAFLELLDLWELAEGWRGRDFFRRYVEDDPTYEDRNVWVAVDARDRLLSCVQIFPRHLRLREQAIPCGGIGSVFTHPAHRRSGLATQVLAAAVEDMRRRRMEISLLFAALVGWYTKLGWGCIETKQTRLRARISAPAAGGSATVVRAFEPQADLAAVIEMHAEWGREVDGGVIRDASLWRASLTLAGNPTEDFRVAIQEGAPVAYARMTVLEGRRLVTEWGRNSGRSIDLARILRAMLLPDLELIVPHCDAELASAVVELGCTAAEETDASLLLRALDPGALATRWSLARQAGESANDYLFRLLEGRPFCFWPADRF